ncbi:uncharacterized protein LOC131031006 [Cryptomeria japonica]|uniref:uncharacterized protein LOC131031006 n=1 Tax=Cryptomeria japonica TaxID=3369 RepID=UPI0027D9F8A0|nr:uncharacterized protein LOC131031006 [Cryptomeria japonica]
MDWPQLTNKVEAAIIELISCQSMKGQKNLEMTEWDGEMRLKWIGLKIPPYVGDGPSINLQKRKECKCCPPKDGWFKLNFDGASRGNLGISGIGYCIHNSKREEIAILASPMGISSNNEAELRALHEAIKLCKILKLGKINIEGDSTIVINALRKGNIPNWKLNAILSNVMIDIQSLVEITFNHIYREGNSRADQLANKGADGFSSINIKPGHPDHP